MNTKKQINKLLKLGLTQETIANESKVSQPTISRILNGLHIDIKASTAVSIDQLYQRETSQ